MTDKIIDESRLLTDEEIVFELNCSKGIVDTYDPNLLQVVKDIAKAQDAKTASILKAEGIKEKEKAYKQGMIDQYIECAKRDEAKCQARVEGIFKEIEEKIILVTSYAIFTRANPDKLKDWQAIKKQAGIK